MSDRPTQSARLRSLLRVHVEPVQHILRPGSFLLGVQRRHKVLVCEASIRGSFSDF
jgi:hypothetical protein